MVGFHYDLNQRACTVGLQTGEVILLIGTVKIIRWKNIDKFIKYIRKWVFWVLKNSSPADGDYKRISTNMEWKFMVHKLGRFYFSSMTMIS